MTVGARKFASMPGSGAEKATRYGVTLPTVSRWGSGVRQPSDAVKQQIEADGGPLVCEWDELEAKPAVKPPPPRVMSADSEASPANVQAEAKRLLRLVSELTDEASQEPDLVRRAAVCASAATISQRLGRMVGAGDVVTERQILTSPSWERIMNVICETITPWPDALAALATRLEEQTRA